MAVVQGVDAPQGRLGAFNLLGPGRLEPAESARPRAPGQDLQHGTAEVHAPDLGHREWAQRPILRLAPQTHAMPGTRAAGATGALVCGCARDAHRLQALHAERGVEAWAAHQTAIDHVAHAFDGDGRLGHVGGQHDLASSARRQGPVLGLRRQGAVQGQHRSALCPPQSALDAADLGHAGQKGEDMPR